MKTLSMVVAVMLVASVAGAQDGGVKPKQAPVHLALTLVPTPQPDPYAACFFSPEDVMAHQAEIKLQDDQRLKLAVQIAKTQEKVTDLQWQISAEQEKLHKAVQPSTVDEAATLKQVDRILALEQEVKRAQMTLMIRVKNALTAEQQSVLRRSTWVPFTFADSAGRRATWLRGDSLVLRRDSIGRALRRLDSTAQVIRFARGGC